MEEYESDFPSSWQRVREFEKELGLPERFFWNLKDEDDWSFIIKLHALFEVAASYLITRRLGEEVIHDAISRLPMSELQSGKIAFLKALGLAEPPEINFIRLLSELRNTLLHDIRNVTFSLTDYVKNLDKNQKRSFARKAFLYADNPTPDMLHGVQEKPKMALWYSATMTLSLFYYAKEVADLDHRLSALHKRFAEEIIEIEHQGGTADVPQIVAKLLNEENDS